MCVARFLRGTHVICGIRRVVRRDVVDLIDEMTKRDVRNQDFFLFFLRNEIRESCFDLRETDDDFYATYL